MPDRGSACRRAIWTVPPEPPAVRRRGPARDRQEHDHQDRRVQRRRQVRETPFVSGLPRARDARGVATRRGSPRRASKPPRVFFFFFFSLRPNNITSNITTSHPHIALSRLSPALSVLVDDPMWDAAQFDVLGATRATFGAAAPARETLRFALVPRSSGVFSAGPSLVTYRPAGVGSAEISGTSNSLPRIPILSQLEEHFALALKVGAVVSLGFCKTAEDWSRGAHLRRGRRAALPEPVPARAQSGARQPQAQGHRGAHQGRVMSFA